MITHTAFGPTASTAPAYDLGWKATHEIGPWHNFVEDGGELRKGTLALTGRAQAASAYLAHLFG